MHNGYKLGSADTSGYYYNIWQRLNYTMRPTPPNTTVITHPHNLQTKKSATLLGKIQITLKHHINVLKYRTGTVCPQKHAFRFNMTSTSARCLLHGEMDTIDYIALRCLNPTMRGMHTHRHHFGLSFCVKAISKGRYGLSLIGRPSHIDPTRIVPHDRDIHLVEFKFCPVANPFPTLEAAAAQHTNTITRLKTRSLRNPNRNNKVTLHIILVGVAGTIYNDYTIKPLTNLDLTRQRAKSLASKLSCHAIQRLTTIIYTRHALHFQGTSGGGVAGRVAVESRRRRVRASRSMADNPPDPH
eukprot:1136559-Pelagomonas_calceolata.AAC.3